MSLLKILLFSLTINLFDDGGGGHLVDAAAAVAPVDPVVALLAPAGAPAVLDDPVGHVLLEERVVVDAEAHDQHAVVQALRVAQELPGVSHSAPVKLKHTLS